MNYRNTVTIEHEDELIRFEFINDGDVSCYARWLSPWQHSRISQIDVHIKSDRDLALKAYRKMAKKYRVHYAAFFGPEFVNEIKHPSILDKQAPKQPRINYYLGMWAFMNSVQVALETTIERLSREFQHENRYPSNRHSEFKALEQIAVGMLCQVQIYGGCKPYEFRKGFKLHFNDRGWNQHLDNPWIKRATRFTRSKLGKQIMAMPT